MTRVSAGVETGNDHDFFAGDFEEKTIWKPPQSGSKDIFGDGRKLVWALEDACDLSVNLVLKCDAHVRRAQSVPIKCFNRLLPRSGCESDGAGHRSRAFSSALSASQLTACS